MDDPPPLMIAYDGSEDSRAEARASIALGSVSRGVVAHERAPVLVIPPPGD